MRARPLLAGAPLQLRAVLAVQADGKPLGELLADAQLHGPRLVEHLGELVGVPVRGLLLAGGKVGDPAPRGSSLVVLDLMLGGKPDGYGAPDAPAAVRVRALADAARPKPFELDALLAAVAGCLAADAPTGAGRARATGVRANGRQEEVSLNRGHDSAPSYSATLADNEDSAQTAPHWKPDP